MTPLDLAANLAASDFPPDRALAVAIVFRGLTDDDGTRAGWPATAAVAERAARFLHLDPTPDLIAGAVEMAPRVSDAMLNRGAAARVAS